MTKVVLCISGDKEIQEFMKNNYYNGFTYQEFAPMLTSELFDPEEWATNFVKAGAKFVLPTKFRIVFVFPFRQRCSSNNCYKRLRTEYPSDQQNLKKTTTCSCLFCYFQYPFQVCCSHF